MRKRVKNMLLMCVTFTSMMICFSTLVYSRFTRQYNPEVGGFGISVSSQENMMISSTGDKGTFKDYLSFEELVPTREITLYPLAGEIEPTTDGTYEELILTENGQIADSTRYLKIPIYFLGSSDMNIYLKGGTGGKVIEVVKANANQHFTQSHLDQLEKNLRIAFLTYSTTYQPYGSDTVPVYSELPVTTKVYSKEVFESENYNTFSNTGYTNTSNDVVLASVKKQEVTYMEVVIWLEEEVPGSIEALCNLTISLRFEAVLLNK